MNWGKKILFVYLIFVAGIVFMVIKSMNQNQDLVTNQYYEQELKFQQKIDQTKRTDSLLKPVTVDCHHDTIKVKFSDSIQTQSLKGSILVYCPNDEKKDLKKEFTSVEENRTISIPYFTKGFRRIKINWTLNQQSYYKEIDLFIKD
jgi:hypothetical protein